MRIGARIIIAVVIMSGCRLPGTLAGEITVPRTNVRSPDFCVPPSAVRLVMDNTGFVPYPELPAGGTRFFISEINPAALDMIKHAQKSIVLSVFLFDNMYAKQPASEEDLVKAYASALLNKKKENPDIAIAVILDAIHRAYGRRISPVEQLFRENGIDVFYSDLLDDLKRGGFLGVREGLGHLNRGVDRLTLGTWSPLWGNIFSLVKLPYRFDEELISMESIYNATLLKANHRKVLVTDDGNNGFVALISSANPHNASASHVNTGLQVRGEPATFIYELLRSDIAQSIGLGWTLGHWHKEATRSYRHDYLHTILPAAGLTTNLTTAAETNNMIQVTVATERVIRDELLRVLSSVSEGDEIRVQMFNLSSPPVLRGLLAAAERSGQPLRLLLDANKDSFNIEKNGTPNRQVARWLMAEAGKCNINIEIRWYATHGEQNHAKIMSICNRKTGRAFLTTGSCNWTGRNLDGINMELNLFLENATECVNTFNSRFDMLWNQTDGIEYSLPYETFIDQTGSEWLWHLGENPFYYGSF